MIQYTNNWNACVSCYISSTVDVTLFIQSRRTLIHGIGKIHLARSVIISNREIIE
jgi:hypothetical protein